MSEWKKVTIQRLATGVPGLDAVLNGGLPEYSFNLIVGEPGAGKTTLAHQIIFANASPEHPALYFTILGEPPLKMLRYQQQLGFFDPELLKDSIRFINLSEEAMQHDLKKVQERIIREVEQVNPALVVVDSFRTVMQSGAGRQGEAQAFVQQLALHLTGCQATTFLVGEYSEDELFQSPVFTVADGIFWLFQSIDRNSIVRKFRVIKLRGQAFMAGLHTFRITEAGIQVFPRMLSPPEEARQAARPPSRRRLSTGVAGLDEMLNGGIPQGDAVLVAGPSGSGKTVLATQFIAAGVTQDEPGVIAVFEEHPREYQARAEQLGFGLKEMVRQGKVKVIYLRPLDLSVDETLQEIRKLVSRLGAKREGSEAAIRVRDTGMGIPAESLPHVFDLFSQLNHSPARSSGGLGLGLTLVRHLVEMHGGRVQAQSAGPGQGSEFVLYLPRLIQAQRSVKKSDIRSKAESPSRRILVVDDNESVADALTMLLTTVGHEVHTEYTGQAALQAVRTFQPEVVLLDIGLPDMDGYEVARRLRKQGLPREVRLIALSGYGQEQSARGREKTPFDHYVHKPVSFDDLQALLSA